MCGVDENGWLVEVPQAPDSGIRPAVAVRNEYWHWYVFSDGKWWLTRSDQDRCKIYHRQLMVFSGLHLSLGSRVPWYEVRKKWVDTVHGMVEELGC